MIRSTALVLNLVCALVVCGTHHARAQSPAEVGAAIAANPTGAAATELADKLRTWFGAANIAKGAPPKVNAIQVAWGIEVAGATSAKVVSDTSRYTLLLKKIGDTNVYAATDTLPEGAGMRWHYDVDGKAMGGGQLEVYTVPEDSKYHDGVPKGVVTQMPKWVSKIFPNSERDWWVYVPAQYAKEKPACVMVFQDGGGPKGYMGAMFDNLIARGDMPVTIGIFIQPGNKIGGPTERAFEYDTLSDQYVRYLLEEILPEVEKTYNLRHDAASRAIAGSSSGGICAFTAAWERPNEFSKVLSWVGSFTDIAAGPDFKQGGHNYPALIRKAPKRDIRVFLQDGENDLDNEHGNWPLANQGMATSLAWKGYDYKFVYGHGFHSDRHGRAILPESLKWLWRDYKAN
ncbi:MAG: alpha/beta hydrolase-fold protein [Chthonomonadales bacterium]